MKVTPQDRARMEAEVDALVEQLKALGAVKVVFPSSMARANRWWRQARADFDTLAVLQEAGKYDICCFLAQQVAEKALKAYLFARGEELVLTHTIFRLCALASAYCAEFGALQDDVKLLDFYYEKARYPSALQDVIPAEFYSEQDATQAIAMAEAVMRCVERNWLEDGVDT